MSDAPTAPLGGGLICAYRADRGGVLHACTPGDADPAGEGGLLWLHLDRKHPDSAHWLRGDAGLEPLVAEALLQEETRPRLARHGSGVLVILRGVNLNPGANPEDMVSIRMWLEPGRLISLRGPRLLAVEDVRAAIGEGRVPPRPGALLAALAAALILRMGPVLEALDEGMDSVEEALVAGEQRALRTRLLALRREAIILRRYLGPQRDVLARLAGGEVGELVDEPARLRLRESADRLTRYVEDLEALRDRAAVAQEELTTRLSDQMNRTMYVLSLVATLFLPLGLVTGLFGVNLAGMPGTQTEGAFAWLMIALGLMTAVQVAFFWLRRWL
ncbi:zinc transporter ZntB [Sediminicurvatus halobius]|uniref:Zinc transporter ZntB n=1 Tax=Sediminicurvatus halobius TaxID=2182432 RepID=A0A2U2MVV1_9GAMM|nr:zinc transporter ZntB [Spiribacter halobius]PWG60987.1 zinc transporter ZntB [Spiribacter halobius]UEX77609.1 zinc transporter ZntB [Spiribacter halobius]